MNKFPELTPMQWAYLAGTVDGGKDIQSIISIRNINRKSRDFPTYISTLIVGNVEENYIKKLSLLMDSEVTKMVSRSNDNHISYATVNPKNQLHFFLNILPYVNIFKEEIKILIKFRETFEKPGRDEVVMQEKRTERERLMNLLDKVKAENVFSN